MSKHFLATSLFLVVFILSSFVTDNTRHIPKVGENTLSYVSKSKLEKAFQEVIKEKGILEEFEKHEQELSKISKKKICYGVWSDDATMCKNKNAHQKSDVSSISAGSVSNAACTRYAILYDCDTYDIYGVWQIGY